MSLLKIGGEMCGLAGPTYEQTSGPWAYDSLPLIRLVEALRDNDHEARHLRADINSGLKYIANALLGLAMTQSLAYNMENWPKVSLFRAGAAWDWEKIFYKAWRNLPTTKPAHIFGEDLRQLQVTLKLFESKGVIAEEVRLQAAAWLEAISYLVSSEGLGSIP